MDPRYASPEVTELWSPSWTYAAWLAIETSALRAQHAEGIVPPSQAGPLLDRLYEMAVQDADVDDIQGIEEETKHDVVAFLQWLRLEVDTEMGNAGRWIHFGLTSSDIVDTAQGMRFHQMRKPLLDRLGGLISELNRLALDDTPLIGRTHGQVAEPITMRTRTWGWLTLLATGASDLSRNTGRMAVCKMSGPVGTYAHNPPAIEISVAKDLDLRPHGPGATQIASRAPLAAWAASASLVVQACAKIAHDIRLMTLLGEAKTSLSLGQVASSSMAHKANPIRAERIEGLARMGAGYAAMLGDVGTWLERDIAQSSVERVAVPDLWHTVIFAIEELTILLKELVPIRPVDHPGEAFVSWYTLRGIKQGKTLDLAREWAMIQAKLHPFDARVGGEKPLPSEFVANYPGSSA